MSNDTNIKQEFEEKVVDTPSSEQVVVKKKNPGRVEAGRRMGKKNKNIKKKKESTSYVIPSVVSFVATIAAIATSYWIYKSRQIPTPTPTPTREEELGNHHNRGFHIY